jgi:hypothetical protein
MTMEALVAAETGPKMVVAASKALVVVAELEVEEEHMLVGAEVELRVLNLKTS